MTKKIVLFLVVLLFSLFMHLSFVYAAVVTVSSENDLINAITNAQNNDVIALQNDIVLTRPIEINGKELTINGNGHTVTRSEDNWSPNGSNGSLITAGSTGTKLTLTNTTLAAAQKYGVQSYNGAYVVLDDVTISGCGYGGVLVNAGTVEIKNLKLNKNGQANNNGIEIAKGLGIYEENVAPTLLMNGTLYSTENENVIYIAVNDNLSTFAVENTESSTNKIFTDGNKVVVTDANKNVLYTSNENPNVPIVGESLDKQETQTPNEEGKNEETNKDENKTPPTGVQSYSILALCALVLSTIGLISLKSKEI